MIKGGNEIARRSATWTAGPKTLAWMEGGAAESSRTAPKVNKDSKNMQERLMTRELSQRKA